MPAHPLLRRILLLLLIGLNVACDQWSKETVRLRVDPGSYTELAGPAFILTRVENTGAFLGFGQSWNPWVKRVFLQAIPLTLMVFLVLRLLYSTYPGPLMGLGLSFIIGGGLGNLWDRLSVGSVTDFFQLRIGWLHTGIFNMADVSVTTGLVLVLIAYFRIRRTAAR